MSHFAKSLRPPRTFTHAEAQRLLDASGTHADSFRDHMVFALAFGAGLRVHEIAALDVGDVYKPTGGVRGRVHLRVFKGCERAGAGPQEILIHDLLARKLAKLHALKRREGEPVEATSPVFSGRKGGRLTVRHMRRLLKHWLDVAGLDTSLRFHEMRHTALTSFHDRTKNVELAQRFARHQDVRTTMRYLHASDEAMAAALHGQLC